MRLSLLLWTGLLSITVANPILDDSDASLGIPDYQGYMTIPCSCPVYLIITLNGLDFEAATDSSHDIELADAACQSLDNAELVYDQENLVIRDVGFLDVVKGQNFCPVKPSSNIPRQRKPRRKPNQTLVQPKPLPRPTFAPEEGWDGKCKHPSWPLALCCATRRFGIDGYKKCTPCRFHHFFGDPHLQSSLHPYL